MSNVADLRLNGLNPLSYQGVNPYTPVPFFTRSKNPSAPTVNDYQNFTLGTIWLDQQTQVAYMLVKLARTDAITTVATWVPFASSHPNVQALQGNTGGLVFATGTIPPYINVVGDGVGINITGVPATNTLTASLVGGGVAAQSFLGDSGTATPSAAGVLAVIAGTSTLNSGSSVKIVAASHTLTLNVSDANSNTLVGNDTGKAGITGTNNTGFGQSNLTALTTGSFNTALGNAALDLLTTGSQNTFVGAGGPGGAITSALHNTGVGFSALVGIITGGSNTALGYEAGFNYASTEANNVVIGASALGVVGETGVVRIGSNTGSSNCFNTFVGFECGNNTLTLASAVGNSAYGYIALGDVTTGDHNNAFGVGSLGLLTTGTENSGFAYNSLRNLTTGSYNCAFGVGALDNLATSGSRNIAIGPAAGGSYTTSESDNIIITTTTSGTGTTGESNTIRVGVSGSSAGQQNATYVAGIYGSTIGSTQAPVWIDNSGKLGTSGVGCAFLAYLNTSIVNQGGNQSNILLVCGNTLFNVGAAYSTTTHLFTAPATGAYLFNITIGWGAANAMALEYTTYLSVNAGATLYLGNNFNPSNYYSTVAGPAYTFTSNQTSIVSLTAGDTVGAYWIYHGAGSNTATLDGLDAGADYRTTFSGYRIL